MNPPPSPPLADSFQARPGRLPHPAGYSLMAGGFACLALLCPPAARGAGATELSGDVLQFALPAAALGLTAWYEDRTGAIEFAESAAATLAVTYTLKYTVSERRPNGGAHSFPSGHTSISFASAEFMRKRYGWEYGVPAYAAASAGPDPEPVPATARRTASSARSRRRRSRRSRRTLGSRPMACGARPARRRSTRRSPRRRNAATPTCS